MFGGRRVGPVAANQPHGSTSDTCKFLANHARITTKRLLASQKFSPRLNDAQSVSLGYLVHNSRVQGLFTKSNHLFTHIVCFLPLSKKQWTSSVPSMLPSKWLDKLILY